jgi:hypothetical protein
MSGRDDDRGNGAGDDAQLKALRQVWLSMRDEDPPERGLDALMAAARSHVQILAKPTLWQRFVSAMRRPPMLALATVMVLLGGVLILTRHGDELEKAPAAPPPQSDTSVPAIRDSSGVRTKADVVDKPVIEKAVQTTKPVPVSRAHPTHPTAQTPPPSADDGFVRPTRGERQEASPGSAPPAGAASGKADATIAKEPNEMLVEQLAAQARSAMTRGDCETAKTIGARIARQDASYYRDHVANELAKCTSSNATEAR